MAIDTNQQKIEELLRRGVEHVYPSVDFLKNELVSGRKLTLYTGYDPTAPTLHIGHGITMLKLREFQDLGHKIIMLIGDFTGMIGDPTDKTSARQQLTREQVLENCKEYKKQAARILNFEGENPVEVKFNSEWLRKMTFEDVVELSSHFTVQKMLERDMFEKRFYGQVWCLSCQKYFVPKTKLNFQSPDNQNFEEGNGVFRAEKEYICPEEHVNSKEILEAVWLGTPPFIFPKPIYIHEFLYPLMQGYDSVAMEVDGEVGGNDQTFNMLAGRTLLKEMRQKEKFVLTTKLLVDDTGKKMSKTEGNMIALSDTPEDMFGKVMRWSDGMIKNGFDLCTKLADAEVEKIIKQNSNPRDQKLRLAYEITKTFLGEAAAQKGQHAFASVIQHKEKPDEIPEIKPSSNDIITVLVESNIAKSKSEARKLIGQGGVKINDEKVVSIDTLTKPGDIVQKGSRFFVKVV